MKTICIVAMGASFLFGCSHSDDEETGTVPATVQIPSDLTNSPELVGSWRADASKQQMILEKDGKLTLKGKVTVAAANMPSRTMETNMVGKWGVKGEEMFFHQIPNASPIRYKWKFEKGKLILDSGGRVKLAYSRE